jgi:hypothetical protein
MISLEKKKKTRKIWRKDCYEKRIGCVCVVFDTMKQDYTYLSINIESIKTHEYKVF